MNLDAFVKSTLEQVIGGLRQAQASVKEQGAMINPGGLRVDNAPRARLHTDGTILQDVEFDVALTVSGSEKSETGLRVGIAWFGGGVEAGSDRAHSTVSRIRFVVPVAFPRG